MASKAPAPPSFPAPAVFYRIQSVDLGSYLELYDVSDKSLVMRPISDSPEQQVSVTVRSAWESVNEAFYRSGRLLLLAPTMLIKS